MKKTNYLVWMGITGLMLLLTACAADEQKGLCSYLGGCTEDTSDCDNGNCSDATQTLAIIKARSNSSGTSDSSDGGN